MDKNFINKIKNSIKFLFILLFLSISLFSIYAAYKNALIYSNDLMWSPTKLFWEHINPYQYYLDGNLDNKIILSQNPNYHHLTYVILYPLSLLSFENAKIFWTFFNFLISILIIFILKKNYKLGLLNTFILSLFFFSSTSFRNVISQGQISIVIFLMILLFFFFKNNILKSIFFSLSFMKYSLSLPLLILGIFKKDKSILLGIIILISVMIFFGVYTNSLDIHLIYSPLKVGALAIHPGESDLVTLLIEYGYLDPKISNLISIIILCFFLWIIRDKEITNYLVLYIFLVTLAYSQHLFYDYVILLPLICIFLKSKNKLEFHNLIFFFTFCFFNYFDKLNNEYLHIISGHQFKYIGFLILNLNILLILKKKLLIKKDKY